MNEKNASSILLTVQDPLWLNVNVKAASGLLLPAHGPLWLEKVLITTPKPLLVLIIIRLVPTRVQGAKGALLQEIWFGHSVKSAPEGHRRRK